MMPAAVSQSTVRPALCVAVGIPACVPTRVSMCGVWLCGCVAMCAMATPSGYALDDTTGTLTGSQWLWTSPAKESLHLGLLALAIDGNELALELVGGASPLAVVHAVLARKMQAFEQFNVSFPGYGGFLPWVLVNASGIVPAQNWESSVPGLDNGTPWRWRRTCGFRWP